MIGSASLTTIVIVVVSLPPLLVAVIVYTVELVIAVGVPLVSPVDVLREIPAGSEGDTDQEVTAPPVEVGETVVIAVPLVSVGMDE